MGKIKVVIDTNVVISALLFGGTPGALMELFGRMVTSFLWSPNKLLKEISWFLPTPKFELSS